MTARAPAETILKLSFANVAARALQVVAETGVADALDDDPRTAEELAAGAGLQPDALARLLRLLEERGIFRRDHDGRWHHTDASRLLRSDHPASLRSFAWMAGTPLCWGSLTHLDHAARTGEAGITRLHPAGTFAYLSEHPDESRIFQAAMTSKAHADIAAVLAAHDFSRYPSVCDVGGGQGHLLRAVLAAHPGARGVLFDLAQVAETVVPQDRFEVVAGDFFVDPLPGADAYVLMNVLHDWDDRPAIEILGAVAEAGRPSQSAVLVLEPVLPEGPERHWSKTLDVLMLASTGGRERTLAEYAELFRAAGLELVGLTPTATPFSIIEARVV
jgi:hypothetical protein